MLGRESLIRRSGLVVAGVLLAGGILVAGHGVESARAVPSGTGVILKLTQTLGGAAGVSPGSIARFNVTVENTGGVIASGARLVDALPEGVSAFSWQCTANGSAICANASGVGSIDEAIDGLLSGASLEYQIEAVIAGFPPPFVVNTALLTLPAGGSCADGGTPPCRATATIGTRGNLDVLFANVPPNAQAGNSVTFNARINALAATAAGTIVRIPQADGFSAMGWTCAGEKGATCPAATGSGGIEQTVAAIPAGGSLLYTFNATIAASPPLEIVQSAIAIPPYGGLCGEYGRAPPCTDTASVPVGARISISKTGEIGPSFIIYVVNIDNTGSDAAGSVFVDEVPAGVAFYLWQCTSFDGAICPQASGSGAINQTIATFPTGGRLQYSITATVDTPAPAAVTNIARLTPPAGGLCFSASSTPPCAASVTTPTRFGGLRVEFAPGVDDATAGDLVVLRVSAFNNTDGDATGSTLSIPLPDGIVAFESWTCASLGPSTCPIAAGSGAISSVLTALPVKSGLEYEINARISAAPPVEVVATAVVTPPAGAGIACLGDDPEPPCVATQTIVTAAQLEVTKTTTTAGLVPGGSARYELRVGNHGARASGVRIVDTLPAGLAGATWECVGTMAECPALTGTGSIDQTIAVFPRDASVLYRLDAGVAASPPAVVTNTLSATTSGNGVCIDANGVTSAQPCLSSVSNDSLPLLEISLVSNQSQAVIGGVARYTLTLRNRGVATGGITLDDPLPVGVDRFDWQCRGYLGAVCPADSGSGPLAESIAALPSGGRLVYTIDAVIASTAAGTITHVASVAPPVGVTCDPVECSASTALPVSLVPAASIAVAKTTGATQASPGSTVRYSIEVINIGSVSGSNVRVEDPLPAGIASMSWTCTGIDCPVASGAGPLNQVLPLLPVYSHPVLRNRPTGGGNLDFPGRVVYTIDAVVMAAPPPTINNIATVTPGGSANCAYDICTSTASLPTGVPGSANLRMDFDNVPPLPLLPGQPIIYSIAISNTGDADAGETVINNPAPSGLDGFSWICNASGGAKCPLGAGNGAITSTFAEVPVGASIRFDVSAMVAADPPGTIIDTVVIKPPAATTCDPASCTNTLELPVTLPTAAVLSVTKTADRTSLDPGGTVTYTITLANTGTSNASPSTLNDPLPAGLTAFAWTCSATNYAICPAAAGSGAIAATVEVPGQSSMTFTVQATVAATPPASIINTATLVPGPDVTCTPACAASAALPVNVPGTAILALSKTADRTVLLPGGSVVYTVTLANAGSADAAPSLLSDVVPTGLGAFSWTCASVNDATCPAASGTGAISQTAAIPAASSLVYTVQATVASNAPDTVVNTATVSPAAGVTCAPASCSAAVALPVERADIVVDKRANPASGTRLTPGQSISWTLRATNAGAPSTGPVTLVDLLPANLRAISVSAGSGTSCNSAAPAAGSELVCTVASGFTGERAVTVTAIVTAADAQGQLRNTLSASGADALACSPCATTHPVAAAVDVSVGNLRPFNAAGISGVLVDIVNASASAVVTVPAHVEPAAAVSLFGVYSAGCTATPGTGGAVVVSCPSPPSAQGIQCNGAQCTIQSLPQNGAATLFIALNAQATATLRVDIPGDTNPANNTIALPAGGSP